MRRFVAILAAALCLSAPAQTPAPANVDVQPHGSLQGTVLCADTGKPARGAIVTANPVPTEEGEVPQIEHATTLTAGDGTYQLRSLPPGSYEVLILLPGYLSNIDDAFNPAASMLKAPSLTTFKTSMAATRAGMLRRHNILTITPGQTTHYDAQLRRGAALSGHVLYADGTPAPEVTLRLESTTEKAPVDGADQIEQNIIANLEGDYNSRSHHPDDRGSFRLFGLAPGKYRLAVLQNTVSSSNNPAQFIGDGDGLRADPLSAEFYAGDTFHLPDATVFDLAAGQELDDIVITLPLNALHSVRGSVQPPQGLPFPDVALTMVNITDPTQTFFTTSQANGTFTFAQIPAGTYKLSCTSATIHREVQMPGDRNEIGAIYTHEFAASPIPLVIRDQDVAGIAISLHEIPLSDNLKDINRLNSAGKPVP